MENTNLILYSHPNLFADELMTSCEREISNEKISEFLIELKKVEKRKMITKISIDTKIPPTYTVCWDERI